MTDVKYFAAKTEDPDRAERYLMGEGKLLVRAPTTDGKWAVVVETPEKFARFNCNRMGRRGPQSEILRDDLDTAMNDMNDLFKMQPT